MQAFFIYLAVIINQSRYFMKNLTLHNLVVNNQHTNDKFLFKDVNGVMHGIVKEKTEEGISTIIRIFEVDFLSKQLIGDITVDKMITGGNNTYLLTNDVITTEQFINHLKLFDASSAIKKHFTPNVFLPLLLKTLNEMFAENTWFTANTSENDNDPEYLYVYVPLENKVYFYNDTFDPESAYPEIVSKEYNYMILENENEIVDLLHEVANGYINVLTEVSPYKIDSLIANNLVDVELETVYIAKLRAIFEDLDCVNIKRKELKLIEFKRFTDFENFVIFLERRYDYTNKVDYFDNGFMLWAKQYINANSYFIGNLKDWRTLDGFTTEEK